MEIVKIDSRNPAVEIIKKAVRIIKNGGIIVYPTDTCYGLGVNAFDKKAIEGLIKLKGREKRKPISVVVSFKMIDSLLKIDRNRKEILKKNLPGPFTFILPFKTSIDRRGIFKDLGSKSTLGIRISDSLICQKLTEALKIPYTATSANISGQKPTYSVKEILNQFKNKKIQPDLILDAGELPKNPPSTVVDLTSWPPKMLRKGYKRLSLKKAFK